jgi:hypothetical protein
MSEVKSYLWTADFDRQANLLGWYRIVFAFYFLFFGTSSYTWLSDMPDFLFRPPKYSLGVLWSGFPPRLLMEIAGILLNLLFVCLLFGWHSKYCSVLITILQIFCNTYQYSLGKIDHNILVVVAPMFFGLAGWGNRLSMDAAGGRSMKPINYYYILAFTISLCFAYFTSGLFKIQANWIDFNSKASGSKIWLIEGYYTLGRQKWLAGVFINLKSARFWEFADYATVAFETTFLVAWINKRLFQLYLMLAVVFHLLILLILNINFTIHFLLFLPFLIQLQLPSIPKWVFTRKVFLITLSICALLIVLKYVLGIDDYSVGGVFTIFSNL